MLQFGRLANDGFPDSDQLPEGHVCMDKVVQVEETIYDEEMRRVTFNRERKHSKTRASCGNSGTLNRLLFNFLRVRKVAGRCTIPMSGCVILVAGSNNWSQNQSRSCKYPESLQPFE